MSYNLSKKALVKKTALISSLTFLSRIAGIVREMLLARCLGIGVLSDAFITAFKIPNFFRHVFAEGALSASFVPQIVGSLKDDKKADAQGLMTLAFLFFEGIVLSLYMIVLLWTEPVARFIAPGFNEAQLAHTVPLLRIMFLFLFFVSSSALLAGALQAVNHFFAPAFGPLLWNCLYVVAIQFVIFYALPVEFLALGVIAGGAALLLLHYYCFKREGFCFSWPTAGSWELFRAVLKSFMPCLVGVSILELNLFIGGYVATYLPPGSATILYYGQRFLNIPIGVFAVAIASTLLAHFSRIVTHAPSRFTFYLLESAKLVTWVMVPVAVVLVAIAPEFFGFMLATKKVASGQIALVSNVFGVYVAGLLFLCLNKIFLSMLYALKNTRATTICSSLAACVNILGDVCAVFYCNSLYGIALANGLSAAFMTGCLLYTLVHYYSIKIAWFEYSSFLVRYSVQVMLLFLPIFMAKKWLVTQIPFVATGCSFWVFFMTASVIGVWILWVTRKIFGIRLYFFHRA